MFVLFFVASWEKLEKVGFVPYSFVCSLVPPEFLSSFLRLIVRWFSFLRFFRSFLLPFCSSVPSIRRFSSVGRRFFIHSFVLSFVCWPVLSFVSSSVLSFVFLRSSVRSSIRSCVHFVFRSFSHPFVLSFLFFHSFVGSFVLPFVPSVLSFVPSFVSSPVLCSFVPSSLRVFVLSSVRPSALSFVPLVNHPVMTTYDVDNLSKTKLLCYVAPCRFLSLTANV